MNDKEIHLVQCCSNSIDSFFSLSTGFFRAMSLTAGANDQTDPKEESPKSGSNTAVRKPGAIQITVMGDSIAKGTGDETGKGFTGNLPELMSTITSKDVLVENVGIDGIQSAGLFELLQSGKLDPVLKISDFVLVSIGGNDLRTLQKKDETSKEQSFDSLKDEYLDNLKKAAGIIRKNNRHAFIIFLGLYNPYVTTGSFVDSGLVRAWNYSTQQLIETDERSIFVSAYDLVKLNTAKYMARDGLHPNAAGYQAIAGRIVDSIESVIVNY